MHWYCRLLDNQNPEKATIGSDTKTHRGRWAPCGSLRQLAVANRYTNVAKCVATCRLRGAGGPPLSDTGLQCTSF